jgi:hypothetical protein
LPKSRCHCGATKLPEKTTSFRTRRSRDPESALAPGFPEGEADSGFTFPMRPGKRPGMTRGVSVREREIVRAIGREGPACAEKFGFIPVGRARQKSWCRCEATQLPEKTGRSPTGRICRKADVIAVRPSFPKKSGVIPDAAQP